MGSCCESCARAEIQTTCAPCAGDVGALFGAARRVDDPNIRVWHSDAGAPPAQPPPDTYTDATLGIVNDVLSSPFAPEVAPVVRVTGLVLELVAKELLTGPSIIADLIPEALSAALAGAGSLAEMIPMLGEIIGVAVEFGGAPERTDDQNKQQCLDWYLPPGGQIAKKEGAARAGHGIGSGSAGTVVPADFFVSLPETNSASDAEVKAYVLQHPGSKASGIGRALRAMSELDPGPEAIGALRKLLKQPQLGVSPEARALFVRMRTAMERSWQDPNTDGGVALWPFYLELFRSERHKGHLSNEYARFLADYGYFRFMVDPPSNALAWALFAVTNGPSALPNNPLHCHRYDPRPVGGALEMLERWRLKMEPTYGPERERLAQMERDGLKLLNATRKFVKVRPGAGPALMRALARPQLRFRPTSTSSSSSGGGAALALGAAAAAAYWGGLLK